MANLAVMERALLSAMPATELARQSAEEYKVSVRQAWKDIAEIYARWDAAGSDLKSRRHVQLSLMRACLRREMLFETAVDDKDLGSALAIERDRCQLLRLYPAQKMRVKHSGKIKGDQAPAKIIVEVVDGSDGSRAAAHPTAPNAG